MKKTFFAEVKSFKDKLLDSFEDVVDFRTDAFKIFTAHILEEMYFLRKQLKFKDEMINSLLNQLAKCIDMLQLQQSNHHRHHHLPHHLYHHRHHYHHLYHHRHHRHHHYVMKEIIISLIIQRR